MSWLKTRLVSVIKGALSVLALLLIASFVHAQEKTRPPDIVVFIADDHGRLDSTVYGAKDVRTPNFARFAKQGMVFTHAFVASPSCAPSRGAMLSGVMPARNGAEANHTFARADIRTLPSYLQALGYYVAAFGKVAHGVDAARHKFDKQSNKRDLKTIEAFLQERDRKKPLCLFVGTAQPHVPWLKNEGYNPAKLLLPPNHIDTPETRETRAKYYTDVTRADTQAGEIFDLIPKYLDPRTTLFIYTSDHGAQWPFGKWNLYDVGIRIPFQAVWQGVIPPGSRSDAMISWIDLLPTLVELGGGTPPRDIDGRSFAKILLGKATEHRDHIFATQTNDGRMNVYPSRCLRTREYSYILNLHPDWAHTTHIDLAEGKDGLYYWKSWQTAARNDPLAAAIVKRYHERPKEELYDVKNDPFQMKNLAASPEHAKRLLEMRGELAAWMKTQGDEGRVTVEPRLLSQPESWQKPVSGQQKKK
jgi:uncharacterized sulfatase